MRSGAKRDGDAHHPIVQAYVSTDRSLPAILRTVPPDSPAVEALLAIHECLAGKRLAKQAIEFAQAVPVEQANPEILVLMLCAWAELCSRIGQRHDAEALVHRARALLTDRLPAEIRAAVLSVEAMLHDRAGNKVQAETVLRRILAQVPSDSPRYKYHAWDLAYLLAVQGRLKELHREMQLLASRLSEEFTTERLLLLHLVDHTETGRIREAAQVAEQMVRADRWADTPWSGTVASYHALLRFMATLVGPSQSPAVPPPLRTAPPAWVEVLRALARNQPAMALRVARDQAERVLGALFGGGFEALNLVRAELASAHAEAARRLLAMRKERGNVHYLDAFFLARIERLSGNARLAARYLDEVLQSADRYDAHGRLDVELRLSCELSYRDLIALLRSATERPASSPSGAASSAPPPPGEGPADYGVDRIIGRSPAIQAVRDMILRLADADAPVLITGETGTGKELVARALHATSRRRSAPFVAVNCGSIAESLLDSELFGHARGAFTGADRAAKGLFEEAGEGVILLDEMGEILPRLQQALLRVLETGEIRAVGSTATRRIRCRILASTNADLNKLATEGRFRKDLLYRLQRLVIELPPLRDRREDILPLARHFLDIGRPPGVHATLSRELEDWLTSYEWPGNVRELKNLIERLRLMHSDKLSYGIEDLEFKLRVGVGLSHPRRIPLPSPPARMPGTDETRARGAAPSDRAAGRVAVAQPPIPQPAPTGAPPPQAWSVRSAMRRLDYLRQLFRTHGKLTRSEVIAATGVSPNTATRDIQTLCREGFIVRVEPSASTRSHYFVLVSAGGAPAAAEPSVRPLLPPILPQEHDRQ